MAVPALSHPCWQKLANGSLANIKTSHLGTQLMAKRMARSTDPLPARAAELHAYFTKWERILSTEVAQLPSL
jgi:hypothetical protein